MRPDGGDECHVLLEGRGQFANTLTSPKAGLHMTPSCGNAAHRDGAVRDSPPG